MDCHHRPPANETGELRFIAALFRRKPDGDPALNLSVWRSGGGSGYAYGITVVMIAPRGAGVKSPWYAGCMKPICHQTASLDDVLGFQAEFRRSGYFGATLPLTNPRATWPVAGDMLAIHIKDSNVTLMAFIRSAVLGVRDPDESFDRIRISAGFKPRAFGQCPSATSGLA